MLIAPFNPDIKKYILVFTKADNMIQAANLVENDGEGNRHVTPLEIWEVAEFLS